MEEKRQQTLFKIRDLRKKDQFKIDDAYLNGYAKIFGPATTAVYNSLSRHAEFYTQEAFPSEELIAEEHNITARTVRTAIKKLKSANIIKISKERRKGKWLNNIYSLIDKSEWIPPEEIKGLWLKTRGKKQQKPEEITRGNLRPIKDNKGKDNIYKDTHTAIQGIAVRKDQTIFDLIELFKPINPTYERLFKNKTQRSSLERLVKKFGQEKVRDMIKGLSKIFGQPYAPTITTPYLLELKLSNYISYIQKRSQEKINFIDFTKL